MRKLTYYFFDRVGQLCPEAFLLRVLGYDLIANALTTIETRDNMALIGRPLALLCNTETVYLLNQNITVILFSIVLES